MYWSCLSEALLILYVGAVTWNLEHWANRETARQQLYIYWLHSDSSTGSEALGEPIKIAFTNKLLKIKSKIKVKVSLCIIKRHNVRAYDGVEV
jgi:hypothetical protein